MFARQVLRHILEDEALTRGLGDPEARILVEWLVDRAEVLAIADVPPETVLSKVSQLRRRGRAISRFVKLWCVEGTWGAALQLACTERFDWPLPCAPMDPFDLMQNIIHWESQDQNVN